MAGGSGSGRLRGASLSPGPDLSGAATRPQDLPAGLRRVPAGNGDAHVPPFTAPDRPGLTGSVNLTVPLTTWLGLTGTPGYLDGFGPVTAMTARQIAAAAANSGATKWCVTVTNEDGWAIGHGCATRRRARMPRGPDPGPGPGPGPETPGARPGPGLATPGARPDSRQSQSLGDPASPGGWQLMIKVNPLTLGACSHERESPGYQPTSSLRHLIEIRDRTCAFPGCRWPAARCDKDHTVPYHKGGRTCWCNIAPLCRFHHKVKQANGWELAQPEPGILIWTAPSGWTYRVTPYARPR